MARLISWRETGVKGGKALMNTEQIRDEIRKLNWIDKIWIYRWINEEVAGDRGIAADRSLKIRQEIERICSRGGAEPSIQEAETLTAER
jgi:hypothetical protein